MRQNDKKKKKKGPVKTEQSLKSHKAGEAEREGKWKIHFHTSKPAHTWLSDPWPLELPECSAYFDLCVWYIHSVCVCVDACPRVQPKGPETDVRCPGV